MNNYIKYILVLLVVTAVAYGGHYLANSALDVNEQWAALDYSLKGLYFFGSFASLIVLIVLKF